MIPARLLVVEDELIVARNIETRLRRSGYTVLDIVSSAEAAIEKAQQIRPDLVLMDIVLQGEMDGIEAARQIWQESHIPVVYLTAYADDATLSRARQTSPFGYILKPLRGEDFHATIQMALQKAAEAHTSNAEKTFLLQEVEHRVRNNLQLILSLLNLQSNKTTDPQLRSALAESQNRILTMALAHQISYADTKVADINLSQYLRNLGQHLYHALSISADQIALQFEIPQRLANLTLPLDQSISCGLIVNELITNAFRHGFHSGEQSGEIRLRISQVTPGYLDLSVLNNGSPWPAEQELEIVLRDRHHIGLRLVKLLTEQLQGELHLHQSEDWTGFSFSLALPN